MLTLFVTNNGCVAICLFLVVTKRFSFKIFYNSVLCSLSNFFQHLHELIFNLGSSTRSTSEPSHSKQRLQYETRV